MSRRPTMRDVAAAAGVSVKTVSRVVNDEAAVRDVVADRVRGAIAALGYRPDHRAQLLRRRGTASSTIGFVPLDVSNPFFSAIYRGLEDVAWADGYVVVAGSSDGTRERGEAILQRLIGARVDGLVVVPAGDDHTLIAEEVGRGTPVVLLDLEVDDVTGVDLVRSDHSGGARLAVRHLIAHGHRDIAFLGDVPSIFSAQAALPRLRRRDAGGTHQSPAGVDGARPRHRRCRGDRARRLFAPGVDSGRARCSPPRTSSRWCRARPPRAGLARHRRARRASTTSTWPMSSIRRSRSSPSSRPTSAVRPANCSSTGSAATAGRPAG